MTRRFHWPRAVPSESAAALAAMGLHIAAGNGEIRWPGERDLVRLLDAAANTADVAERGGILAAGGVVFVWMGGATATNGCRGADMPPVKG